MPTKERERIRALAAKEDWAKAEYGRIKAAAAKGDGYLAAFLYALEGDAKYLPAARKLLLDRYGPEAYWVKEYRKRLANPDYFKAGQPGIPDVYYDIDITGLTAFDWVYNGLNAGDRKTIEDGILTWARFKMRCMDRWTQTPNLVFKPTFMVAMTGLVTQDRECLEWGFRRQKPWGGGLGGYFVVLDTMLKDGGPWHEAPIYPGAHSGLLITALMSRYRGLHDGKDWFSHKMPKGGSVRGLLDYYLDSAYPIEMIGPGAKQVRVANYGDGSTNAAGDLFLVSPTGNPGNILLHDPLVAAYNVSGDPRYAPFVGMIPGYKPDLWDRRPVLANAPLPAAPSKVWPDYGLAMLRSDESSAYWTSGKAIAAFQLMSQGYGHDHRDKFSITLHGAGRLLYPNYNAIQYENPMIGWTRNSVSHNTLVVDEGETCDARPSGIRHEFAPEVKFLATSASGVFQGVDQTRALLLTREYLLDLFSASSKVPHTYDYLLHSFGEAREVRPGQFKPTTALQKRYWLVDRQQGMVTPEQLAIDLVLKEKPGSRPGNYGQDWYDHTASVRVTMAAEPGTQVVHGVWGDDLAKLVAQRQKNAKLDRLTMLAARRTASRNTVFAVTHEPFANADQPQIKAITTLARSQDAVVVRVDGRDFTDYAAVAFGPQKEGREHLLDAKAAGTFGFKSYCYLRLARDGSVTARGGWTHFQIPGAKGPLTVNGQAGKAEQKDGFLTYGTRPKGGPASAVVEAECPLQVKVAPAVTRVFDRDRKAATFTISNLLKEAVSGKIEFDLPDGLTVEPAQPTFGPVPSGSKTSVQVTFIANKPQPGKHVVPYRIVYRPLSAAKEIRSLALPVVVAVGPTMEFVYQHPRPPVYVLHAPKLTAKFDMFHGLCRYLADDDDTVRLDGSPLFTFSDGKEELLGENTKHAFTWPHEAPAHLTAHAYDRCRWQALPFGDRLLIRMDSGWTQFAKTHFTIPGKWVSPRGQPRWKRIVALDTASKEMDAPAKGKVRLVAAELEFPGAKWNLAFKFEPAQEVAINGTELKFQLGSLTNDSWQVGFCRPGELDSWRGKK